MAHVLDTMPVTFDAAENEPIFTGRSAYRDELRFEPCQVDVSVGVFGNRDDIGDRLAPRQLVGVVLERTDEDDRPLGRPGCAATGGSGRRDRPGAGGS